jgi:hypothetical protein
MQSRTSGKAIAALVLGISAIVIWPLAIILGPLAIYFGISSKNAIRLNPGQSGNGMAIAGIVLGSISLLFGLIVAAAVVFVLVSNLGGASDPEFAFAVDASGPGGVLTVVQFTGVAEWSDFALGGDAQCSLPNGEIDGGDEIVCVSDGDVILYDWFTEDVVYSTTV